MATPPEDVRLRKVSVRLEQLHPDVVASHRSGNASPSSDSTVSATSDCCLSDDGNDVPSSAARVKRHPSKITASRSAAAKDPLPAAGDPAKVTKDGQIAKRCRKRTKCLVFHCPHTLENYPTLFRFPNRKDQTLALQWYDLCTKEYPKDKMPKIPSPLQWGELRVCDKHFLPDDLDRNLKYELLGLPVRPKLKVDAFPSVELRRPNKKLNPFSKPKVPIRGQSREEREAVKARKALVAEILQQHEEQQQKRLGADTLVPCSPRLWQMTMTPLQRTLKLEEERLKMLIYDKMKTSELQRSIPEVEKALTSERMWVTKHRLKHKDDVSSAEQTDVVQQQLNRIETLETRLATLQAELAKLNAERSPEAEITTVEELLRKRVVEETVAKRLLQIKLEDYAKQTKSLKRQLVVASKKTAKKDAAYLKASLRTACSNSNTNLPGKEKYGHWEEGDVINAMLLRVISKKAYKFIRAKKMMPLPGFTTLRRWRKLLHLSDLRDIARFRDDENEEIKLLVPDTSKEKITSRDVGVKTAANNGKKAEVVVKKKVVAKKRKVNNVHQADNGGDAQPAAKKVCKMVTAGDLSRTAAEAAVVDSILIERTFHVDRERFKDLANGETDYHIILDGAKSDLNQDSAVALRVCPPSSSSRPGQQGRTSTSGGGGGRQQSPREVFEEIQDFLDLETPPDGGHEQRQQHRQPSGLSFAVVPTTIDGAAMHHILLQQPSHS